MQTGAAAEIQCKNLPEAQSKQCLANIAEMRGSVISNTNTNMTGTNVFKNAVTTGDVKVVRGPGSSTTVNIGGKKY